MSNAHYTLKSGKSYVHALPTTNFVTMLQNTSSFGKAMPSIRITRKDPGWEQAYRRWLDGLNPTESPEWKKGVFGSHG